MMTAPISVQSIFLDTNNAHKCNDDHDKVDKHPGNYHADYDDDSGGFTKGFAILRPQRCLLSSLIGQFVMYLYCICIVFVMYLYCISNVFVQFN